MLYLIGFIITIGLLVTIHEWGHFIVARIFNVKVLCFSIGFGKILLQRVDKQGTQWALSAIPLGGYVKMLDSRNEEVPPDLYHLEYNRKKVWQRMLIVAAGPLINILFAFLLFVGLHLFGIKDVQPILGAPIKNSPAELAGIVGGEKVLTINQKKVAGWLDIREQLVSSGISGDKVYLQVQKNNQAPTEIIINSNGMLKHPPTNIGLRLPIPDLPPVINKVVKDMPADLAGLKAGDEILTINSVVVKNWQELSENINSRPEQRITIEFMRNGANEPLNLSLMTKSLDNSGKKIGIIGIEPNYKKMQIPPELFFRYSLPLPQAISRAFTRTWDSTKTMVRFIVGIFQGQVSWRFLNGPLVIAEVAGKSLADGLNSFVQFICAVSISLGVINLFPLPVLDGGHLVFLTYEWIMKKPPSKLAFEWLGRFGVVLILLLMITALYNDIFHFFG